MTRRSGYENYEGIWGNEYYDKEFQLIDDLRFSQKTFMPRPALVSIMPNPGKHPSGPARFYQDGHVEVFYHGQDYDKEKYRLVETAWTHEHCDVCQYAIVEDETYWLNTDGNILCDVCYDHYVKSGARGQSRG